ELLLVDGGLLVGAAAYLGGVLLCLGVQRGALLVGDGAAFGELPLYVGAPLGQLLLGLGTGGLDLPLDLAPSRLQQRLGLGSGLLNLLGALFVDPLRFLLRGFVGGLALGLDLLGVLPDLDEFGLRGGAVFLRDLVRLGLALGD